MDLNIENYNLNDLLNVFKIKTLDENSLRVAKKVVYKSHPDKSSLNKEYFLFFSKAYKLLYQLYLYKNKESIYLEEDNEIHTIKTEIQSFVKKDNFLEDFNLLFEKTYMRNDDGHGDWLKEETTEKKVENINEMNEYIEEKKNSIRSIIKIDQIVSIGNEGNHYDLIEPNDNYGCKKSGSLHYNDVKQVHSESVIPVSKEDMRQEFGSLDDYKRQRNEPFQKCDHKNILLNQKKMEETNDTYRTFELLKKDEIYKKMNNNFFSNFKRISN